MENPSINSGQAKASAKDFFLHLGAIVALYVIAGNFINLLFRIINKAYPEVASYNYYFQSGSEISLPVATLIIVFPIFVILSSLVNKIYEITPEKRELGIRKWLTYITLFVAGIMLAGDLVMVLYKFLDGQDLTLAFLLKALVVLLVSGVVFGFYIQDIREQVSIKQRKMWAIIVGVVILISIILGFSVIGSPQSQRLIKQDNQKIMDLQNMQYQIINYWQINGTIPEKWESMMIDGETDKPYEYKKTGAMSFKLCAEFNKESMMDGNAKVRMMMQTSYPAYPEKIGMMQNDNWEHPAGSHCFSRTIDPIQYPTQVRG